MKWITRERAKVDRIACPWLIRRWIDPEAEFLFVPADRVRAVAKETGAIPFDIPDVEFGHHGEECTFDALLKKYQLNDPGLAALAKIVRGADTGHPDLTPESAGLLALAEGFRAICRDDFENIEKQFPVYDALYACCRARG
ncbi:MAG: chromate resistance protein [Candidatus Manganitrophaceae bacterium]|nr:MAG: chromate resistance protein [Candidatus Manganitrophaceae bacterium]